MYNLNYREALERIYSDMSLNKNSPPSASKWVIQENLEKQVLKVDKIKFIYELKR